MRKVVAGTMPIARSAGRIDGMTTELANTPQMRASDAERERVVTLLQQAGADGRLTLPEVDERVSQAYAATYRNQLPPLTADLPTEEQPAGSARATRPIVTPGIRIHAVIAIVLSVIMITRWATMDTAFFWPFFPMMWLWGSLAIRVAIRRGAGWSGPPWAGPRWAGR